MNHHNYNHNTHRQGPAKTRLGDLTPLLAIFAVIIAITWLLVSGLDSLNIFSILRNFMAVFFLVFGSFKVLNLKGFADAYGMYDLIAKKSRFYGHLYPFIELALGLAYLFSFKLLVTNWVTLVIMLVSALGVYLKLRKKEVIPCACLGTVFKVPMTWVTLGEDLLMALMALGMIVLL